MNPCIYTALACKLCQRRLNRSGDRDKRLHWHCTFWCWSGVRCRSSDQGPNWKSAGSNHNGQFLHTIFGFTSYVFFGSNTQWSDRLQWYMNSKCNSYLIREMMTQTSGKPIDTRFRNQNSLYTAMWQTTIWMVTQRVKYCAQCLYKPWTMTSWSTDVTFPTTYTIYLHC